MPTRALQARSVAFSTPFRKRPRPLERHSCVVSPWRSGTRGPGSPILVDLEAAGSDLEMLEAGPSRRAQ